MKRWTAALALAGTTILAHAGGLDEVMKMQKNGMWELKPPAAMGKPVLFCVTDTTRIGSLKETREAVASLGCKTVEDTLKGDRYEIELDCRNADPNVGNFRMSMKGTARPDFQSGTTTVTGGGPMIRGLFPSGKAGDGELRWLRPCKAGEKPGLQESR